MLRVVAAALTVALLGACSLAARQSDGTVTITVQVSGEPEETRAYEAITTAFEDEEPGIDVDLVVVADKDEHLQRLTTAFAGGSPPDVFLVNFREYAQFVARGAVEPVGPLLAEQGVDLSGYYEPPLEAFTFGGTLTCMPQNVSSLVVYYNRDLFRAAGMKAPPRGWDWAGFRETARRLTSGEVHGLGIEPQIIRIAPFVWSNGGDIVDDADRPTRLTLDEPAAREALEFIVSLVRTDRVVPSERDVAAQDLETRFATGKLAMLLTSRRDTPVFREVTGLSWDVAPLPVQRERAGILHSDGYCVSADSEAVDAAARYIAFATGEQGQTLASLTGRVVPVLRRVAQSPSFLDPAKDPRHSRIFLDAVPAIRRTPVISTWTEIEDVAEQVLTRAFYEDGFSIDDALRALDAETRPLFAEARDA